MKSATLATTLAFLTVSAVTSPASAAPPQVFALTDLRIVTAPGKVIENGTVVLRDGIIEAVSADIEPPADARVHCPGEPAEGEFDWYVVRVGAEYCNETGAWSSGGSAESVEREDALP